MGSSASTCTGRGKVPQPKGYERAPQEDTPWNTPVRQNLGQPMPVGQPGPVGQPDAKPGGGCSIRRLERCCCCFGIGLLIALVAWWLYGNWLAKITLVSAGSHVTGVNVSVSSTWIAALNGQLVVTNVTVANPGDDFIVAPYFLNCKTAFVDINWNAIISSLSGLVKIDELTVLGLTMYLENENFHSNMEIIMKNIAENPVVKFATEHRNENQRFMIQKVKVIDLQVHTIVGGVLVPLVKVPPLEVGDVGVQQNGVPMETLVGMLIESFALEAAQHKVNQMASSVGQSLQELSPKKVKDL